MASQRHVMCAGRLRHEVRVEVPVETRDAGGQPAPDDWEELCTVRACVQAVSSREAWVGGREVRPDATEVVVVRHRAAIADAGGRLRLVVTTQGDRVLQAVGVERDEQGAWLTIHCKGAGKRDG